jgi:hypothetical protein
MVTGVFLLMGDWLPEIRDNLRGSRIPPKSAKASTMEGAKGTRNPG